MLVSPPFPLHPRTPQSPWFYAHISWARQDEEGVWVSFRALCYAEGIANVHANELRVHCKAVDLMGPGMSVAAADLTLGMGKGSFLGQQGSHGSGPPHQSSGEISCQQGVWNGCFETQTQHPCMAHLYGTEVVRLFWNCQQIGNLQRKGRNFRTAVILCCSPEDTKPALDGDVKVPLQCFEEQMVSSVYAEKGDLN